LLVSFAVSCNIVIFLSFVYCSTPLY